MTDYEVKDPNACRKLVEIINTALPDATDDLIPADLEIDGSPDIVWYLNLDVCISIAGVLSLSRTRTVEGTPETWTEKQNSGTALIAGAGYRFTIEVSGGDAINLVYSTTTGTINKLRISEVV